MFNNRLSLTMDYYYKSTDPLLIAIGLPASSGLPMSYNSTLGAYTTSYNTNLGKQIAKGFTATLQYYIIRNLKERLTWSVRGTLRSESAKLDGIGNTLSSLNNFGQNRSTQRYYDGADPGTGDLNAIKILIRTSQLIEHIDNRLKQRPSIPRNPPRISSKPNSLTKRKQLKRERNAIQARTLRHNQSLQ